MQNTVGGVPISWPREDPVGTRKKEAVEKIEGETLATKGLPALDGQVTPLFRAREHDRQGPIDPAEC